MRHIVGRGRGRTRTVNQANIAADATAATAYDNAPYGPDTAVAAGDGRYYNDHGDYYKEEQLYQRQPPPSQQYHPSPSQLH